MFGISGEHLVVLVVILLLFGPKRLPELGNTLGKAIKNFKDAVAGVENAKFRKIEDETNRAEFRADDLAKADAPTTADKKTDSSKV
jgi:sec-independent protein translocase protein TatA